MKSGSNTLRGALLALGLSAVVLTGCQNSGGGQADPNSTTPVTTGTPPPSDPSAATTPATTGSPTGPATAPGTGGTPDQSDSGERR